MSTPDSYATCCDSGRGVVYCPDCLEDEVRRVVRLELKRLCRSALELRPAGSGGGDLLGLIAAVKAAEREHA